MKAIEKLKEEDKRKALACKWHNEVKSLNFEVGEEDTVEPMDITVKDGRRVYQRGILFVMTKAFYELYPDLIIKVEFQLQNSIYCTIDNCKVTDEMIQNVKKKMQDESVMTQHLVSMLRYMGDQHKFVNMMEEYTSGIFDKSIADYIEENGISSYGFSCIATKADMQKMLEMDDIIGIVPESWN